MALDGKEVISRYNRLKSERYNFDDRWERMAPLISPSRVGIITKYSVGEKQSHGVYDSTTMLAAEMMAMFIAGHIINPSQQWFRFTIPGAEYDDEIQEWLEECRDRTNSRLAASQFYAEGPEALIDYGGFGTGFLLVEEAPQPVNRTIQGFRGFHFRAERTGRFCVAEGGDGLVDTAMREFDFTARILANMFPDTIPENIRNAAIKEPDKQYKIIHTIQPRPKAEQGAGAKGMAWASGLVENESKVVLRESGYRTFPASVFRYTKTPGEVYGRGRGDLAFPDASTLNTAKRYGLEDWALKIRPPVMMRNDSVIGSLKLVPGGPTRVNTHGLPIRDVIMPWETGSRPDLSQIKEEELRRTIREVFFVDSIRQLLETHKSEMTALEYARKIELLFRIMGPVYGRLEWEFLYQTMEAVFDVLYHAKVFSDPPASIAQYGGVLSTEFDNPISKAQKAGDAEALTMVVNDMAPMAQIFPQMWDRIDPDKTAVGLAKVRGLPAKWSRSDREIAALRKERQKHDEQQVQMEQVGQAAQAAGDVAPLVKALSDKASAK